MGRSILSWRNYTQALIDACVWMEDQHISGLWQSECFAPARIWNTANRYPTHLPLQYLTGVHRARLLRGKSGLTPLHIDDPFSPVRSRSYLTSYFLRTRLIPEYFSLVTPWLVFHAQPAQNHLLPPPLPLIIPLQSTKFA